MRIAGVTWQPQAAIFRVGLLSQAAALLTARVQGNVL